MTTKLFRTSLLLLFFFATSIAVQAQEKQDIIMVFFAIESGKIHVLQNNTPEKIIETGNKKNDFNGNRERLLNVVSQLTGEGWEIITVTTTNAYYGDTFYLKRKKR